MHRIAPIAVTAAIWLLTPAAALAACPGECSVPGTGNPATECIVEYDGVTFNYPPENPKQLRCVDGDPTCDEDGVANGLCLFTLRACINNTDPRFAECAPSDVAVVDVKNKPLGHPKFDPALQAIGDGLTALGLPTAAAACTEPVRVRLPLRDKKGTFRRGKKKIVTKAFTSSGIKDVDKTKLFCLPSTEFPSPSATYARAFEITEEAHRIGGQLGRSDLGDVLMVNDKIQVAIQRPGRHAWNAVGLYGGNLIDADRHHGDGIERDSFEVFAPGINIENTPHYTSVVVLNDGTDGNPAVVQASGPDDLLDFVNPSSVVAGFGLAFPPAADDTDLAIDVTTTYTLAPGDSHVTVETTIDNNDAAPLPLYFADYLNGSGQLELFQPVYGFGEALVTTSCGAASYVACALGSCDRCNYVAYSGEDDAREVSYGYIHTVNGTTTFSTSGATIALLGQEGVLSLIGLGPPVFTVPASGSLTVTRFFAVGDGSAASIAAIRDDILDFDTGTLAGTVTSDGEPVADADVAVTAAPLPGFGSRPARNVVAHFRTGADGSYAGTLPPGSYTVDVNKDGRLSATPVAAAVTITSDAITTQDFTLPAPGRLRVTVSDENDDPVPAKVQVVGFDPSPNPANDESIAGLVNNRTYVFGDGSGSADGLPYGILSVAFAGPTGDTGEIEVEPGTYQVAVSHGPRYSGFTQNVVITAGEMATVAAQIARVVPTPGWISGDWHVHSLNSADCEVTNEERVLTELAEGMDFFTPSDHEVRVDFTQTIADLGVGSLIATAPSEEITTFDYGHFNSWPVTVDPSKLSGGGIDHGLRPGVAPGDDFPSKGSYALAPVEIFDAAHADPKTNLVQINHMASFFNTEGLDVDTADAGTGPPKSYTNPTTRRLDPSVPNFYDDSFDALEVWIGTNGRGGILNDFLGGNFGDWVNLLNQNMIHTGVTSSDTHQKRNTQINARSYVASSVTDPGLLAAEAETLAATVVEGRVIGSNGPFVRITSSATSTGQAGGLELGLPTLISTTDTNVDITVEVWSPLWAEFDTIEFYVNSAPQPFDHDGNPATRARYRVLPDYTHTAGAEFTVATVDDYPLIPGGGHLEATTTLSLTGLSEDIWVIAIVKGSDGVSKPIFPFHPNSISTGSNPPVPGEAGGLTDGNLGESGMPAFAYTNPLYVDWDDGSWTAPGVSLTPP